MSGLKWTKDYEELKINLTLKIENIENKIN